MTATVIAGTYCTVHCAAFRPLYLVANSASSPVHEYALHAVIKVSSSADICEICVIISSKCMLIPYTSAMMFRSLFCFLVPSTICCFLLATPALSANPVRTPIVRNALNVHTRPFAKLPEENGSPSRIICIVPLGRDLYVCSRTKIYRVSRTGKVSLWMDVAAAIFSATRRRLNVDSGSHGGLRSIAFHPNFRRNRLFYLSAMEDRPFNRRRFHYISNVANAIRADSVLLEFRCDRRTNRPIYSTYRNLFRVGMPVFDHPIKQIAFYGKLLYIAHGDGSVQSAIAGGGQGNNALGKILRIDPLKYSSRPYRIPLMNPFRKRSKMPPEVYALGFRNPHNLCFAKDGTLLVADAGRANVEEVNIVRRKGNYGWSKREGTFVHTGGGLLTGVRNLPPGDEQFGFIYPAAQVGHEGSVGAGFIGQAIAGGCPVQNGSPMSGNYFYADFPETGKLYFSSLRGLKRAVTKGPSRKLTQAPTKQAVIFFDHDNNPRTPPKRFNSLGDAMRSEFRFRNEKRVDVRFGRGSRGELYWSSKTSGRIYIFTSSLRGGPGGVPGARSRKRSMKK